MEWDLVKYSPEQPRDEGGRWASGGSGAGPWTRAFDARGHQKVIDEHRAAQEQHSGKAQALTGQIAQLRAKARGASPAVKERLKAKIETLADQREGHRAAAAAAKANAAQAKKDMDAARSDHAWQLRAQSASRRAAATEQSQREAINVIGQRIGGGDEHEAAAEAQHTLSPGWHPTQADTEVALQDAELQRQALTAAAVQRDREAAHAALAERLGVGRQIQAPEGTPQRQVVSHAEPQRTQAEWNLHDQLSRESQRASDDRAEARNRMATPPMHEPRADLPTATAQRAGLLSRARSGLGRLLGAHKSINGPESRTDGSVWSMAQPSRYNLKLSKLDLISLVDVPAQEPAAVRLIKRKDGSEEMEAAIQMRVEKIEDGDSPLAYGWAFVCTKSDGTPYHDLQGDAIQPGFIKAAAEWLRSGGGIDEMHDGKESTHAAFAFPWDQDIAKALLGDEVGSQIKTSGLMIAVRPTPDQLEKLRKKEFNGFSIAGTGIRELLKMAGSKCPTCGKYGAADAKDCASCGGSMTKATWTRAFMDDLPDSSFLYVESGGEKDSYGKTTPRTLRHFPYKDDAGKVDLPHLRNALSRIPQSNLGDDIKSKLTDKAQGILDKETGATKRADVAKGNDNHDERGRFSSGGGGGSGGGDKQAARDKSDAAVRASESAYKASGTAGAKSANLAAAKAHADAAHAQQKVGNEALAHEHASRSQSHTAAAEAGFSVRPGPMTAPDGGMLAQHAGQHQGYEGAAGAAHDSSAAARASGTAEGHANAAAAHAAATEHATAAGNHDMADMHAKLAAGHADMASHIANASGKESDHGAAKQAHGAAFDAAGSRVNSAIRSGDAASADKWMGRQDQHIASTRTHRNAEAAGGSRPTVYQPSSKPSGARRSKKRAVLTSAVDGHQHSLDLDDPCDEWRNDQLSTSGNTAEGADQPHSHAWTYDSTTGAVTIAEDSGHDHTVTDVVPQDVLRQAALNASGDRCGKCGRMCEDGSAYCSNCGALMSDASNGIPKPTDDDDDDSGPNIVLITARAPNADRHSTQPGTTPTVKSKETEMAETDNLRKMLATALVLSEPERAYVAKMDQAGREAFLVLDAKARKSAVDAALEADPEVYKTKDGQSIRKSAGELVLAMAKRADEQAEQIAKQALEIETTKAAAAQVTLEKRAGVELSHFAKSISTRVAVLKAIEGIADEKVRAEAVEMIKGANFGLSKLGAPLGADDPTGPQSDNPSTKLEKMAKAHAEKHNVSEAKAYDAVLQTKEGADLYALSQKAPTAPTGAN